MPLGVLHRKSKVRINECTKITLAVDQKSKAFKHISVKMKQYNNVDEKNTMQQKRQKTTRKKKYQNTVTC